jgi:hypothetical protein
MENLNFEKSSAAPKKAEPAPPPAIAAVKS